MATQTQNALLADLIELTAPRARPHFVPAWAPDWAVALGLVASAVVAGLVIHAVLVAGVRRALKGHAFWLPLIQRTRRPSRLAFVLLAVVAVTPFAPLTPGQAHLLRQILLMAVVVAVGWGVLTALDIGAALYMRRFRVDEPDNLAARKHLTQVRILRQAAKVMVMVLTAGLALMTIPGVRQFGVSLLAAGGAAGIIVGLALQPLLSNLLAGIQIATTQPIRIDDQLHVEGEVGNVEEITSTYVVVRLWDGRRLILPLTYFLQKPFQNWSRETLQMLGAVMLYVDYATPVGAIRARLTEILAASKLWDGRVGTVQVTDAKERTMEVRCLVSAADAGKVGDLRAEVREKMIAFLLAEHPEALPRDRLEIDIEPEPPAPKKPARE